MTAAAKRPDWEFRLEFHINASVHRVFRYGAFDCCTFAADAILAMTGADIMWNLRNYSGAKAAKVLLKSLGGLEAAAESVARENGMDEVHPIKAQRGDMVMLCGNRPAIGIVGLDGYWAVIPSTRGLYSVPLNLFARAWRVGCPQQ